MSVRLRRWIPEAPVRLLALALGWGFAVWGLAGAPVAFGQITELEEVVPVGLDDEEEDSPFLLWGLTGFGALGNHDMTDLNEAIAIVNAEIANQGSFGVQFDGFDNGPSIGGGLKGILRDRYLLQVEYERLIRSNKVGGITAESEIRTPADVILATVGYDLLNRRDARLGFAAGLGWYSSKAEQVITETLQNEVTELGRIKLDGTTLGQHYQMFFETKFTDRVFVTLTAGYRVAKIDDLEIKGLEDLLPPVSNTAFITIPVAECVENCPPEDPDGAEPTGPMEVVLRGGGTSLDWSGFMGRVSFTIYVNIPTL